jgi:hypothetical protein
MYLSILSALLLFIILAISFRKSINLLITRLKSGRYSYAYQILFRKYFNSNPHPYCYKDELLQHLIKLRISAETPAEQCDELPLNLPDLEFDVSSKHILKLKGKPQCFNAFEDKYYKLKLLGYADNNFKYPAKMLYYFSSDHVFAMDFLFEDFTPKKHVELIAYLGKYFHTDFENQKTKNLSFPNNISMLYTNTGFRISLKFYSGENPVFKQMITTLERQQHDLKNQIETQFFASV